MGTKKQIRHSYAKYLVIYLNNVDALNLNRLTAGSSEQRH